jgi:hypothetical protein
VCLSLVTTPSVAGRKVSVKNAMRTAPAPLAAAELG